MEFQLLAVCVFYWHQRPFWHPKDQAWAPLKAVRYYWSHCSRRLQATNSTCAWNKHIILDVIVLSGPTLTLTQVNCTTSCVGSVHRARGRVRGDVGVSACALVVENASSPFHCNVPKNVSCIFHVPQYATALHTWQRE